MFNDSLSSPQRIIALLVRHGRTSLNASGRVRGWEDVPLNSDGEGDAYMAGNKLKIYRPKIVYSSDLDRDTKTACIIAELCGDIPYETDFALRTADIGTLTGQREDATRERLLRWYQQPWEPAPSGESFNQFTRRYWKFYENKLDLARHVDSFRPIVMVSHGRNIAYADSSYRGVPPEQGRMPFPGGIAVVRTNGDMDELEFLTDSEPVIDDN